MKTQNYDKDAQNIQKLNMIFSLLTLGKNPPSQKIHPLQRKRHALLYPKNDFFLRKRETGFLSIKGPAFLIVKMEFLAGRIFPHSLIEKIMLSFLDILGISVIVLCFKEL